MEQQLRLHFWTPKEELPTLCYWSAREWLEEEGWERLGTGACATAFQSPDGDKVIKVCGGDYGARATAEAAIANPDNPHLPNVYWMVDLADGGFAVECELLKSCPGDKFRRWSNTYCPGRCERVRETLITGRKSKMKDALLALQHAASAYEGDGLIWDTHAGNLMVRPSDGKLVLNDCLYAAEGSAYEDYSYDCESECGCNFPDCTICKLKIEPQFALTLPIEPFYPLPSWRIVENMARERAGRLHAQGRHCGAVWCVECAPPALPLAA